MPNALIVEDENRALHAIAESIELRGFSTFLARNLTEAKREFDRTAIDFALVDILLPDGSGIDLLLDVPKNQRPHVTLMSGQLPVSSALKALNFQSVHFLQKPLDLAQLHEILEEVRRACKPSEGTSTERAGPGRLVGRSSQMNKLYELIRKVAPTELSVMIEGESGTGKELIAESIHAESKRSDGPFVVLNCGAVPENLIDSELFGHERGSFTGATRRHDGVFHRADGGTLFLDEVTEMPIELQSRLLRVLETGRVQRVGGSSESTVDVRILAATNRTVAAALTNGQLREDLCYRLSAFPIKVPPLRQRGPDVAFLADHFLTTLCEREQKHKIFHPSVTAVFEAYHWPGNVRQLKNEVEYAYVLADDEIRIDHLSQRFSDCQEVVNKDPGVVELRVGASIEQAERKLIEATLRRVHGDKRAAAEVLGISLRTLYNRVREYGNRAEEQQQS